MTNKQVSNLCVYRSLATCCIMQMGSILHFLDHKTILVTGATGFLGKSIVDPLRKQMLFQYSLLVQYNVWCISILTWICINVVFVEKILRVQPHVKKLYLLVRASDAESALLRLNTEVLFKYYVIHTCYVPLDPCSQTHKHNHYMIEIS